jgi:hypothetical protein
MKPHSTLLATILLSTLTVQAQQTDVEPDASSKLETVQTFNSIGDSKPNEVTVVLDPPATESPAPVLVTGTPPSEAALQDPATVPAAEAAVTATPEVPETAPKPQPGLAVHVETLKTGSGVLDGKSVKLSAPFPAKPLSQPPAGWRLETPENTPAFTRTVALAPGSEITLTIRPHLLVPAADGATTFSIAEPGYDPTLGYLQTGTVGAILSGSIKELDENSKQLGSAIENLQQILVSLPKSAEPERRSAVRTPTIRTK